MATTHQAAWTTHGPMAARRHGKPGRETRPTSLTLDAATVAAVRGGNATGLLGI